MRKISLIIAVASTVISAPVMAQNVTYACQYIKSAGLEWIENRWEAKQFHVNDPFFLVADKKGLIKESVAKALDTIEMFVDCSSNESPIQSCIKDNGAMVISFNAANMSGGVSRLFGATQSKRTASKDSVSVSSFTCTKM